MFKKEISFIPAWDKRDKGNGIHCVEMRAVLTGPHGAISFCLFTGWQLKHVVREWDDRGIRGVFRPIPADISYHSYTQRHSYNEERECQYLEGGKCFSDGSSLAADDVFNTFIEKGEEGLWASLEEFYRRWLCLEAVE